MGKTAIVYYSQHHGNTKKVLDAIADYDNDVTLVDVTEKHEVDLTGYDRITKTVLDSGASGEGDSLNRYTVSAQFLIAG